MFFPKTLEFWNLSYYAGVMDVARREGLGYSPGDTLVHRLTGASKAMMVLLVSLAAMISYDTRFLLVVVAFSVAMLLASRVPLKNLKNVFIFIGIFMIFNNILHFLFSPEHGVDIYGTRTELGHLFGGYYLVLEQLFFQLNVTIKYFAILPIALIFFVTTEPSEFAASLNKIGLNYKFAYSISLAMRYIPDVQREYWDISQAQQARGVDMSREAKLPARIKGMVSILLPLIVTSIDKIERIANAMELRSFGKKPRRSWYRGRSFGPQDYVLLVTSIGFVAASLILVIINGGRFFNPFV